MKMTEEGEYMGIRWRIVELFAYILLSDLDVKLCKRLKIIKSSFGGYFIDDGLDKYDLVYENLLKTIEEIAKWYKDERVIEAEQEFEKLQNWFTTIDRRCAHEN
jgi:hypothetical protein